MFICLIKFINLNLFLNEAKQIQQNLSTTKTLGTVKVALFLSMDNRIFQIKKKFKQSKNSDNRLVERNTFYFKKIYAHLPVCGMSALSQAFHLFE